MNILYIGQYTPGTTSKMRADQLRDILKPESFHIIDTHIPFHETPRLWRSLGFRYKKGPLIKNINNYIIKEVSLLNPKSQNLNPKPYALTWIDKAIFLTPKTTRYLKSLTEKLIHFTPDMAFYANQSMHFEKSIKHYDYLMTTKTAEKEEYFKRVDGSKLVFTTQGYDTAIHKPLVDFDNKTKDVAFIGLCEPSREEIVEKLINANIKVKIAGKGWQNFIEKHKQNNLLSLHGDGLFSNEYTKFISSSLFSIGLLSKKFPELHTTRTFEIPACGTALITEKNNETTHFFNDDEAIFYDKTDQMIEKILYYQDHPEELETLTLKGTKRVHQDGRDYESILRKVLKEIGFMQ